MFGQFGRMGEAAKGNYLIVGLGLTGQIPIDLARKSPIGRARDKIRAEGGGAGHNAVELSRKFGISADR